MIQNITEDSGGKFAVIHLNNHWYNIPFSVLEDICHQYGNNRVANKFDIGETKLPEIDDINLRNWLGTWACTWEPGAGLQLQEILKSGLPDLEAYKLIY